MDIVKIITLVAIAFGVYVAFKTFHNPHMNRNTRFKLAMEIMVMGLCSIIFEMSYSKPVEIVTLGAIIFIFIDETPRLLASIHKDHQISRRHDYMMDRLSLPIELMLMLACQRVHLVNVGGNNTQTTVKFLKQISSRHRALSKMIASDILKTATTDDISALVNSFNKLDIDKSIKSYWKHFKD